MGQLWPYKLRRNVTPISHLFYADDMLIFRNGRVQSLQCLRTLLNHYEASSGQQVNLQKSACYASKRIPRARIVRIQNISGYQAKRLPFKYLGTPIYKGRCKRFFLMRWSEKLLLA